MARAQEVLRTVITFALLILLAVPFTLASSKVSSAPLDAYTERKWEMQDGLPEQIVQAFAQTADHYLWIGTTGGLLRFDGASFVLYDRESTPAFRDNNIFCLTVSRDNSLLYEANLQSPDVTVYSVDDGKRIGSAHVGDGPAAMAFSGAGHLLFVVDSRSDDVAVVRTGDRSLFTMLPAGRNPSAIVVKAFKVK